MSKEQRIQLYEANEEMKRAAQRLLHSPAIHMTAALERLEVARAALDGVVQALLFSE